MMFLQGWSLWKVIEETKWYFQNEVAYSDDVVNSGICEAFLWDSGQALCSDDTGYADQILALAVPWCPEWLMHSPTICCRRTKEYFSFLMNEEPPDEPQEFVLLQGACRMDTRGFLLFIFLT